MRKYRGIFFWDPKGLAFVRKGNNFSQGSECAARPRGADCRGQSRLGGVMRIRRAILPAIVTLGLAGSVLTGVTAGAAGVIGAPTMHYHGHVIAMHYHGRMHYHG
jgi:hypothetical protein